MKLLRIVAAAAASAYLAVAGFAQQSYALTTQDIRAGVVILDGDKFNAADTPQSEAPHIFYNLSRNSTVRPAGWNIFNPHAPSTLSGPIKARWTTIDPTVAGFNLGMRLTKRHAPYWEVFLSQLSDTLLADYDFLVVNPHAFISLNSTEREKLRRFVDHGGVLWVDSGGVAQGKIDLGNNLPIPFTFKINTSAIEQADFLQPILNRPLAITRRDISYLDSPHLGLSSSFSTVLGQVDLSAQSASSLAPILGNTVTDFLRMQPFILIGGEPTATIARIGDGFVVTTSRFMTGKLNTPIVPAGGSYVPNTGFIAQQPNLDASGLAGAKLAVNMMYLATEYRQLAGGSRKTSSSFVSIGAPLLRRSTIAGANSTITPTTPVMYKGITFIVNGDRVIAYDGDPQRDLDGDGDPDDGVRDLSAGAAFDRLWTSQSLTTPISTPTCVEIPNPYGRPRDVVMVVDGAGAVQIFDIMDFTGDLENKATFKTLTAPTGTFVGNGAAPNPVSVHEGIGYITDSMNQGGTTVGRVWAIDLRVSNPTNMQTGSNSWIVGGPGTGINLPDFCNSPTIGYIPIADNSGGIDRVMYIPYRPQSTPKPGPGNTSGFISLWLGARGEKPVSYQPNGGYLEVETRASTRALPIYTTGAADSLGVRITLLDASGSPMSANQMTSVFSGNVKESAGRLQFEFASGVTDLPATVTGVRVDYTIDLGNTTPGMLQNVERGRVGLFNGPGDLRVIGSIAMSPRGTLYLVLGDGNRNGTLLGFREVGRGSFTCVSRYGLYERHNITLQGSSPVDSGLMFEDNDGINNFIPTFGTAGMSRVAFASGPSVANGLVYVLGSAERGPIHHSVLLTFTAEPAAPTIRVGDVPDGTVFAQMDIMKSTNTDTGLKITPDQQSIITTNGYTYDRLSGTVRFDNLMGPTTSGPMQNCLSLSQPIIVRKPGAADVLVYPDSISNSVWSPLQWYMVFHGVTVPSRRLNPSAGSVDFGSYIGGTPFVSGSTVFLTGTSALPNILNFGTLANVGIVYAINGAISPNDAFLVPNATKPWIKQAVQLKIPGDNGAPIAASTNVLWPQNYGIDSFETYKQRLNQTVLPGSAAAVNISGGDGVVVVTGDQGIYTYSRADLLVCDEGRVARFDPSGNPIWSTTGGTTYGSLDTATVGNAVKFVRPTRAYKVGYNDTLIVDTDGNRISRLNFSGAENRSISKFQLDLRLAPPSGFRSNEATTLSGPRDVVSWATYEKTPTSLSIADGNPSNEYWVHFMIADTGNKRLIELVDRYAYDPLTGRIGDPLTVTAPDPVSGNNTVQTQLGMLVWHTPASVTGKNYDYVSISRAWVPNVPLTVTPTGRFVFIAGIGSALPVAADLGASNLDSAGKDAVTGLTTRENSAGNGGVIVFDPINGYKPTVITALNLGGIGQNVFFDETSGAFNSAARPAKQIYSSGGTAVDRRMTLSGVQSVTARTQQDPANPTRPSIGIMVADSQGAYEFNYTIDDTGNVYTPTVNWYLPNEAYRFMRRDTVTDLPTGSNPLRFKATYAKRLDSGDVLIVNGYTGPRRLGLTTGDLAGERKQFTGEILEIEGSWSPARFLARNLGFNSQSILFELPSIQGIRGLVQPVFATRN